MPGKQNPVLSVLLHRTGLAAPAWNATLHVAAASANDERPDGGWHAEWETMRVLARRTLVAADQTTELLSGLHIDADAMARNIQAAGTTDGEQRTMARLVEQPPSQDYTGIASLLAEESVERARRFLGEDSL